MKLFTEYPEAKEYEYYDRIASLTKRRMDDLFKDADRALRDTHAKTHGCVQATLEIFEFDQDVIKQQLIQKQPAAKDQFQAMDLKQGLLATAKRYPVWIRFANGRTKVDNDFGSDTRSMSVKVMGVDGERLPQSHEQHSQDIITQNADIFFIKNIRFYEGFFKAVAKGDLWALFWLFTHPKQFSSLKYITKRVPKSLLTETYWSGSASSLGLPNSFDPDKTGKEAVTYPAVVKFGFFPKTSTPPYSPIPNQSRPEGNIEQAKANQKEKQDNYYRDEMVKALAEPDAKYCWDFSIQIQTSPEMSIDDVTVIWDGNEAPFFPVGRLTVAHQEVNIEKQCDFCENMRFAPWNGLAAHRPVGALNRLRRKIYPIVAEYRHNKQNLDYQEPHGNETFS